MNWVEAIDHTDRSTAHQTNEATGLGATHCRSLPSMRLFAAIGPHPIRGANEGCKMPVQFCGSANVQ